MSQYSYRFAKSLINNTRTTVILSVDEREKVYKSLLKNISFFIYFSLI
jgi:hypothetical protein